MARRPDGPVTLPRYGDLEPRRHADRSAHRNDLHRFVPKSRRLCNLARHRQRTFERDAAADSNSRAASRHRHPAGKRRRFALDLLRPGTAVSQCCFAAAHHPALHDQHPGQRGRKSGVRSHHLQRLPRHRQRQRIRRCGVPHRMRCRQRSIGSGEGPRVHVLRPRLLRRQPHATAAPAATTSPAVTCASPCAAAAASAATSPAAGTAATARARRLAAAAGSPASSSTTSSAGSAARLLLHRCRLLLRLHLPRHRCPMARCVRCAAADARRTSIAAPVRVTASAASVRSLPTCVEITGCPRRASTPRRRRCEMRSRTEPKMA